MAHPYSKQNSRTVRRPLPPLSELPPSGPEHYTEIMINPLSADPSLLDGSYEPAYVPSIVQTQTRPPVEENQDIRWIEQKKLFEAAKAAEAEARRKALEREETQRLLVEKLKKQHEKHQQDILSGQTHHRSRGDSYNEGTSDSTTKPTIHTVEETIKHVQNITNEKNVTNVTHTNEIDKVEQHTTVETAKTFAQDHTNLLIGVGAVAVVAAIYLTHE